LAWTRPEVRNPLAYMTTRSVFEHWPRSATTRPRLWIFKGDENPQYTFLRMGSRAEGRKILLHVEDMLTYLRYWYAKSSLLCQFLYSLPDVYAARTSREFWWTSREFSLAVIIITMALHGHISPGGRTICPLVAAVLRYKSHRIDMMSHNLVAYSCVQSVTCFCDSAHVFWCGTFKNI
jgi:hypothetical protein